jgi:hypothetical protein
VALNYDAIRRDNERRYGTDIGRIGSMLLADRYDDRTHFIYELLQNAEDALAKRTGVTAPRSVRFLLSEQNLHIRQFGKPFDEADVRGICGIGESTKDLTAIGHFGIGFKSVFAFSDRPEVHSGDEDFAIESFVWPVAASSVKRAPNETVIVIALREHADRDEIAAGLQRVGPGALLFLREIEEIEWAVERGMSGIYLRGEPVHIDDGVRRITVIGQAEGQPDIEQTWLLFSRPMRTAIGKLAGHVEVAFQLVFDEKLERERVRAVSQSPLVVFFPTVVDTNLGFLVQGPYRTTPSRDNVPHRDLWNQQTVNETASVVIDALRWFRDREQLNVDVLRCLPLDPNKFSDGTMFVTLFDAVKLSSESLLPRFGGGYVAAGSAKLARTQELRELFDAEQLGALFADGRELAWISGDISQDRTPELRLYLMRELDIAEVNPETVLAKLSVRFLEAQSDLWVRRLYEFLGGQPALVRRTVDLPVIRLTNGRHVKAHANGQIQAFLPGTFETSFPTVRADTCDSDLARAFLHAFGLTSPDPVDDVVWNVLPKYREAEAHIADNQYEADIRRIIAAFSTDSKGQREKMLAALRDTPFVMAVATGDGSECVAKPGEVYLATERLKELFAGISGVLRVDDRYPYLSGEGVRELLEASGASRYMQAIPVDCDLTWVQRRELRRAAGLERVTWESPISDVTLRGLEALVAHMPLLPPIERRQRSLLLWQALADVEERRGARAFLGEYKWGYSHEAKTATFDAAFVRLLNERQWVPDPDGNLQRPEFVLFESLGWKANPFLQSKVRFEPPIIEQLAKAAGIEPGALDLLRKLGVTSEAELRIRLGVNEDPVTGPDITQSDVNDGLKNLLGDFPQPTAPVPDPAGEQISAAGSGEGGVRPGTAAVSTPTGAHNVPEGGAGRNRTPGSAGGRPFISYVAVSPEEEELDPDVLDHAARGALEEKAIGYILKCESVWRRTNAHNPGFDLHQGDTPGAATRWCEVKAMTGSLGDRPVGLSHTQFYCAAEHGEAYWLYVVEHAGSETPRLVRIQDPAGNAKTFTFDHGWVGIAQLNNEN